MKNRVTSESGSAVSLFPFLAVLLCTMGALLVLLVVLAQRVGERIAEGPQVPQAVTPTSYVSVEEAVEVAQLQQQLAEARAYQKKVAELREQADQRLLAEQQRLTHLEEHARRLEHELARLSLASEQLKATEQDQVVDQQQAERELERLQKLVQRSEAELEELREQAAGEKSYAIVPYQGANGTSRRPIYIECRRDGIFLQPAGVRLKASDFVDTSWPGNPLAAAIRATRQHISSQATAAGAPEPPDPYPLILVRPDGIRQYGLARAAITSWDADFGYEFIDDDWQLSFPEAVDPQLARIQQHAIMLSREQLARLIRSAPRRFRGVGLMGGKGSGGGGDSPAGGYRAGGGEGGDDWADDVETGSSQLAAQSGAGGAGSGSAAAGSSTGLPAESGFQANDATQIGGLAGDSTGASGESSGSQAARSSLEEGHADGTGGGDFGDRYAQTAGVSRGGAAGAATGGSANGSNVSPGGGATGGSAASGSAVSGGSAGERGPTSSIADSHGRNWAVPSSSHRSVPIQRTIQVVVRKDWLALLPSRHALEGALPEGKEISLQQTTQQLSQELVAALRARIDEWGLAGQGLYWRPVLKLNVSPDAGPSAQQVVRLLNQSGVEVRLSNTAQAPAGESKHAPR